MHQARRRGRPNVQFHPKVVLAAPAGPSCLGTRQEISEHTPATRRRTPGTPTIIQAIGVLLVVAHQCLPALGEAAQSAFHYQLPGGDDLLDQWVQLLLCNAPNARTALVGGEGPVACGIVIPFVRGKVLSAWRAHHYHALQGWSRGFCSMDVGSSYCYPHGSADCQAQFTPPNSLGRWFHWQPLRNRKIISSSVFRWSTRLRPLDCGGSNSSITGSIRSQIVDNGFTSTRLWEQSWRRPSPVNHNLKLRFEIVS